jgi:DNA polymerase-3 subunit alpha
MAGYTIGAADLLRKAMGKKDANLMAEQKQRFLDGAAKLKVDSKVATEMFDQIETFARYGFNKAHATCYALVAYHTAWLKHYYPKEFMAALMTSEMSNSDRIMTFLEECRRMGIKVLPPDVNESQTHFTVVDDSIRFGLLAVKNVGEAAANAISAAAAETRFENLADLTSNVEARHLNRRTLESLVAAGACDSLDGNRAAQTEAVEAMLDFGHKVRIQSASRDLFAGAEIESQRVVPPLPEIAPWSSTDQLNNEKTALGFWISGHPLDRYRDELASFTTATADSLDQVVDGREVTMGGVVARINQMVDKRGNLMGFVTLEDFSGQTELIIFSDCFEKSKEYLSVDRMVLISGRVATREEERPKVICSELMPLEKLTERFSCQLVIKLEPNCAENTIERALATLDEFPGKVPVLLAARENGSEVYIKSGRYSVTMDFELLNRLKELLGDHAAYLRPIGLK